ncbi:MAG: 3-oxoacyl-[acyl-carrier-protein] reductase [Erysipelotrichaceae bacterium]
MDKKIAVVSGATKGIGLAIAKALVKDGYYVIGTYVSDYSVDFIASLVSESFELKQVNSSDSSACEALAEEIKERFGSCSVLVNNAGITKDGLLMRMSEADFKEVLSVNLGGTFNMTKALSKDMMRSRSGCIVNIASIIGLVGNVGQANYAASKAGIIGFSKSLAKELAARNIRVNCVAPGFIETAMTEVLSADIKDSILNNIAMKKLGSVDDVANAVSFLVSDKARYITGQTLNVCGGLVI